MTEKENFPGIRNFTSKGKLRLFGLGSRSKGLVAAGLLSVAALVPQTAEARPHRNEGVRKAADIVSIVAGGVSVLRGVGSNVVAQQQQAKINKAMKDLVAKYQADIQNLNEEYAAFTQKDGYTDQATALQVKRYLTRNAATQARAEGKADLAQAYEARAASYAKNAVAMDNILSAYADQLVKPSSDGLYHEDEIVSVLTQNRANIDKARLNAVEQKAQVIRANYNKIATQLAQTAQQNRIQIQMGNWQTIMGTNMILGSSFHLYDMSHRPSHHSRPAQPRRQPARQQPARRQPARQQPARQQSQPSREQPANQKPAERSEKDSSKKTSSTTRSGKSVRSISMAFRGR